MKTYRIGKICDTVDDYIIYSFFAGNVCRDKPVCTSVIEAITQAQMYNVVARF